MKFVLAQDSTIEVAMQTLRRYNLLSLPVTSSTACDSDSPSEQDEEKKTKFLGLLGVSDIVNAIVFDPSFVKYESEYKVRRMTQSDLHKMIDNSIFKKKVKELVGRAEENKYLWVFKSNESMSRINEYFAKGTHRVLLDRPGSHGGMSVLSQADAVRYLDKNLVHELVAPIVRKTIAELGLGVTRSKMVTLRQDETALAGFRQLLGTSWSSKFFNKRWEYFYAH